MGHSFEQMDWYLCRASRSDYQLLASDISSHQICPCSKLPLSLNYHRYMAMIYATVYPLAVRSGQTLEWESQRFLSMSLAMFVVSPRLIARTKEVPGL